MCIIYINISSLNMTIIINTQNEIFRPKTMCFYGCTILIEMFSSFCRLPKIQLVFVGIFENLNTDKCLTVRLNHRNITS